MSTLGPLAFWPAALWLFPLALAALILFRLRRARQREVWVGSLLIWRRLAARQPKTRPPRIIIDLSLVLQAAVLAVLAGAAAGPSWASRNEQGRTLVVVADNGPPACARQSGSVQLWQSVLAPAARLLQKLDAQDRVLLAVSAPLPQLVTSEALTPQQAVARLAEVQPALSGPEPSELLGFAAGLSRRSADRTLPARVFSLQGKPAGASDSIWSCVAPPASGLRNTAIVAFGSAHGFESGRVKAEVLVRIRNFSKQPAGGVVKLEEGPRAWKTVQQQNLTLASGAEQSVVFPLDHMPAEAIRIVWQDAAGADSFPGDDAVIAVPRRAAAPRVRFHGSAPAVKELCELALHAEILEPGSGGAADLEIFVRSVPEHLPDGTRAVMLLAPETGYRVFDVGGAVLANPKPQRDEPDPLTKGVAESPESLFSVSVAKEILHTGDYRSLLKDEKTGRTLFAEFQARPDQLGFVFAFVPEELSHASPLAAILVRTVRKAAGSGDPFAAAPAESLEQRANAPLPADWQMQPQIVEQTGGGVLDEKVSSLALGPGSSGEPDALAGLSTAHAQRTDLTPWLIALAMALAALERALDRRARGGPLASRAPSA